MIAAARNALLLLDRDPQSLDPPAREAPQAFWLADHVLSDGLASYVDNLGNHWRTARRGLKRLRLHAAAKTLTDAAMTFGRRGPPEDDAARLDASLALSDSQQTKLKSLDKRMLRAADRIQRKAEEHMRRHSEQFRVASR